MQYQPNREQRELVGAMDDAIAAILPLARCHERATEDESIWASLSELGLFSLAISEADGGLGLGAVEEVLIAMSLGRQLASPSVFATMASVHAGQTDAEYRGARTAPAMGFHKRMTVIADEQASQILLRNDEGALLHALEGAGALMQGNPWFDQLARPERLGEPRSVFDEDGLIRLQLLNAAGLVGLADRALEMAVDYSKMREQFGRAIGSYQAVKHHCANMAVAARTAQDMLTFAAVAVDQGRDDAAFLAEAAFVSAAHAASGNAAKNIQIHGGIGFSAEADPHLFVKRAQILIAFGGGVEQALERAAAA